MILAPPVHPRILQVEDERESKRSKSRSRKTKEKKRKSRTKHSSIDDEEAAGPVPLSKFFGSLKN